MVLITAKVPVCPGTMYNPQANRMALQLKFTFLLLQQISNIDKRRTGINMLKPAIVFLLFVNIALHSNAQDRAGASVSATIQSLDNMASITVNKTDYFVINFLSEPNLMGSRKVSKVGKSAFTRIEVLSFDIGACNCEYAISLPTEAITGKRKNGEETLIFAGFNIAPPKVISNDQNKRAFIIEANIKTDKLPVGGSYLSSTPLIVTVNFN